jgi:SAM-dependent methyltransferase
MLKLVTKKDYWALEDAGICKEYPPNPHWHLKSIQDAVAWSYLRTARAQDIAEIGGGQSRLLHALDSSNRCYNIEPFEGVGQGPKQDFTVSGVTNLKVNVGSFSDVLQDNLFDLIFSVSVVEHVPTDGLPDFFADCHRILKPGGRMVHLIDLYLENADGDNARPRERCAGYVEAFREGLFQACGPMEIGPPETVVFRTDLVTNPDDMMNRWNRSVPQLRDKRERAQSCTLLMVGSK